MADERCMYVGTEKGIVVLAERDGEWCEAHTALPGKFVHALVASNQAGQAGVVFAGVAHDGIYASDDGRAWDRVFSGDVHVIAVDPSDPATVYAGTEPVHLFRSHDAGDSWVEVEGLQRMPEHVREKWWFPQYPHEGHVRTIFVEPQDSRVIFLGLEHGGICRTEDGGEHWEDRSAGIEYLDIHTVATDPGRPSHCYAATAHGFYRSEHDGHDWVLSEAGLTRDYFHDLVVRPGEATTLFLATANGTPPAWLRDGGAQSAIFRSVDAGQSWQQLVGELPSSMERMAWSLVGDPLDASRLYAGMGDYTSILPKGQVGGGEVWASLDRGDTWAQVHQIASPIRSLCVACG